MAAATAQVQELHDTLELQPSVDETSPWRTATVQVQEQQKDGASDGMADEPWAVGMEWARTSQVRMVLLQLVNAVDRASAGEDARR